MQLRPLFFVIVFGIMAMSANAQGYSLRFFGQGVNASDNDRVKIQIDDYANTLPGPQTDVGSSDFTIKWWMRGFIADNESMETIIR